ncbi:MAG: precorrin-4 C(11)-methyltransferase, partial [Desulfocucumaceae bacterium]
VNPALLEGCRPEAQIYDSAGMNLEEVLGVMVRAWEQGKTVARVHTGDPSIYGAIQEQMDALKEKGIDFKVIPGVSSIFAAAAAIPHELTLPEVSQTVILTRLEGRTPVPSGEKLSDLARHRCTICIFLSVNQIEKVVEELLEGGYSPETGAFIVEKASWPEERIIKGKLSNIAGLVKEAGIKRQALIMVGEVFGGNYSRSKLYDENFSHGFRESGK